MTKQEFITALREALAPMEEQERAAHCDYYAEMIDDMLEAGLTEAEAIERLGDPAALAREMRGEVGGEPKHISLRESLAQIMRSFASVRFGPGESWSRAEEHSFSGNIRSLDVQWRSGETEIAVSDRDGVELIEYRSENAPAMVTWQQEDTLFVRYAPDGERCREAIERLREYDRRNHTNIEQTVREYARRRSSGRASDCPSASSSLGLAFRTRKLSNILLICARITVKRQLRSSIR